MSRYTVETAQREGEETVVLRDSHSGAEAHIWPGCGNNCFLLRLPVPNSPASAAAPGSASTGRPSRADLVTVIQAPPQLDEIRRRPSWWGVPLLFPFPGSMPGGAYEFEGRRLRLGRPEQPVVSEPVYQGNNRPPDARRDYHGFVMDLPWQVIERRADDHAAIVRSALDSTDYPAIHEGFPF